jgi:hypothetical protein
LDKREKDWRCELRFARLKWPGLPVWQLKVLKQLLRETRFSVRLGEIIQIENHWYVTHSGLLKLAVRRGCIGISTKLEEQLCDATAARWVFSATVYKPHEAEVLWLSGMPIHQMCLPSFTALS